MSKTHGVERAKMWGKRHAKMSEIAIGVGMGIVIAVSIGITYAISLLNFTGSAYFGYGAIVLGLIVGLTAGYEYTARRGIQMFHWLAVVIFVFYFIGVLINWGFPMGSWLVNIAHSTGSLGIVAAFLVGIAGLALFILGIANAKASNLE